jgi:hypothetical protein
MWPFKKKIKEVIEPKKVFKIEEYEETVEVGKLFVDIVLENGHTLRRTFTGFAYFTLNSKRDRINFGYDYGDVNRTHADQIFNNIIKELDRYSRDKYYDPLVFINGGYYDGLDTYHFNTKVLTVTKRIEEFKVQVTCQREVEVK